MYVCVCMCVCVCVCVLSKITTNELKLKCYLFSSEYSNACCELSTHISGFSLQLTG